MNTYGILKVLKIYFAYEDYFVAFDSFGTNSGFRTLQTAVGVFGGDGYTDRADVLPLMVANAGNSFRAAISSQDSPPIVAVELCREHLVCNSTL